MQQTLLLPLQQLSMSQSLALLVSGPTCVHS